MRWTGGGGGRRTAGLVGRLLAKDLRLGPRSPVVLWALVLPVVATVLIRGVFGGLLSSTPRLGVVDRGDSAVTAAVRDRGGIEVTVLDDPERLRDQVAAGDLDAGLVLQPGFDAAVRAGQRPPLQLVMAGRSAAADRLVVAVTTLRAVRGLEDRAPPVNVEVVALGEDPLAVTTRLLPLLVVLAVAIAGAFVPAASLVEEKEHRTLDAVLVTPATIGNVLLAKGALGVLLALTAGLATLALNGAFSSAPAALVLALVVGAVMMAEVGLLLGIWAPDVTTMFTAWKAGAIVLVFPVVFYVWPSLPAWIGRLGPTSWFLEPVYRVAVEGDDLAGVWPDLLVAAAIVAALAPAVVRAGRWLEVRLAAGSLTGGASRQDAAGSTASGRTSP